MNCFINLPIRLFSLLHPSSVLLCVLEAKHVCSRQAYYFRQYRHTDTHTDARPEINTVSLLPPQELGSGPPSGLC